jgi:purine nucleosidase
MEKSMEKSMAQGARRTGKAKTEGDDFVKSPSAALRGNFVVAAHPYVRLTPQFLRALHLELFSKSSIHRFFTRSSKEMQRRRPDLAKKVIIDCDPGVDDALALILAFHSPELEVRAVTGVNGNVPLDLVFANIQKVLSLLRPSRKPWIARGAREPLEGRGAHAREFHGEDGLGGAAVPESGKGEWWRTFPRPAHELLCEAAAADPGAVTLIALGPLTNLALALDHDPEAMRAFREIIIMGGAVRTGGNITPHAEFNIYVDPLAASRVFSSGLPLRLVPLDVTRQAALTPAVMNKGIGGTESEFVRFVNESTGYDRIAEKFLGGREAFYLHDPLAVGAVILPDLMGAEWTDLRVVTEPGERYGKTEEVKNENPGGGKVGVGFKVNAEAFLDLFISRLKE